MKKLMLIVVFMSILLTGCVKTITDTEDTVNQNSSILVINKYNEKDIQRKMEDYLIGIYNYTDDKDIQNSISSISDLCTVEFIKQLRENTVNNKSTSIGNIKVHMTTKENNDIDNGIGLIVTYSISNEDGYYDCIAEYRCRPEDNLIDSCNLWYRS